MDINEEYAQREEFRNILFDLALLDYSLADDEVRTEIYKRLEKLYYSPNKEKKYRHFYSDIFIVLTQIQQGDKAGTIDILGENLRVIRTEYQSINSDEEGNLIDIQDSLRKLYDHVSLDIARITYSDAGDRKLGQKQSLAEIRAEVNAVKAMVESTKTSVEETQRQVGTTKEQIDDAAKQVAGTQKSIVATQKKVDAMARTIKRQVSKVENAEKEYIAILGIFSSVVLTFTAGIAFSTSVLQNIHQASIYRTVFVSLTIGIVLANVLYGLFFYIDHLVRPAKKPTVKPLWVTNAILIVLMIGTCLAWCFGVVEKRNTEVASNLCPAETLVTEVETTEIVTEAVFQQTTEGIVE